MANGLKLLNPGNEIEDGKLWKTGMVAFIIPVGWSSIVPFFQDETVIIIIAYDLLQRTSVDNINDESYISLSIYTIVSFKLLGTFR